MGFTQSLLINIQVSCCSVFTTFMHDRDYKFMISLLLQPFSLRSDSSHEQASLAPSALAHGMTLPSTGSSCHSSHETAPFTPSSRAQEWPLHAPFHAWSLAMRQHCSRLALRPLGESYQSALFSRLFQGPEIAPFHAKLSGLRHETAPFHASLSDRQGSPSFFAAR